MTLAFGPFDLLEPVARGGVGEVWRATHRAQTVPVAVKIVPIDLTDEAAFRARFAREVQAMAQLNHPAVAQIYDYGELEPEVVAAAEGRLPKRAMWLAMEWLGGGSLHVRAGMGWPVLRATLLTLLDALAHAHAHGVIHLDLKPDNVLLARRGPVLTDFGLAFSPAARRSINDNQVFGTPGYMAPEQIHGKWRDYGPWTDLYALGCVAWEMICGHVPHGEAKPGPLPLMMAHVTEPLPRLDGRMKLPAGFDAWLERLLARQPADRFRFAADAAVALLALPEVADPGEESFDSLAEAMGSVEWCDPDALDSIDIGTSETLDIGRDTEIGQALRQVVASSRPPTTAPPLDDDTLTSGAPLDLVAAYEAFSDAPDTFVEEIEAPGDSGPLPPPIGGPDTYIESSDAADASPFVRPGVFGSIITDPAVRPGRVEGADATDPVRPQRLELATEATAPALPDLDRETTDPVLTGDDDLLTSDLDAFGATVGPARQPIPTVVMGPVFLPVDDLSWALGPRPDGRPPMPESWTRHGTITQPPLLDAGEALVRLRTPPPVGRVAERDALWSALREVVETGETRMVLIEGPAGQGKTHLARWLGRRAHELGVADRITVHHGTSAESTSGVGPALTGYLNVQGLDDRGRLDRIRALTGDGLDADTSRAFAASLTRERSVQGVTSALMIASETELDTARAAGLAALTGPRPIVLHLDDVQWGWTSLRFALHLLDQPRATPVLIVATVRDDAVRPGSLERGLVKRVGRHDRTTRMVLEPLPPMDLESLVTSLLPVAPRLVQALVQRTSGNPLFAVELMRHWIGRGALRPGPDGFRLSRRDALDDLPTSQTAVWTARLSHVLRRAEDHAAHAFELAAFLGPVVEQSEWAMACAAIGGRRPKDGFRRMLEERLIHPLVDGRWTFGTAMLREVLLEQARTGERWQRWHGICADVLRRMGNADPGRLLRHLAEAGRDREALPQALKHTDDLLDRGDWIAAESTLLDAASMLRRIHQPPGSRAWTEIHLRWSRACILRGAADTARRRAQQAADAVQMSGNAHLQARALLALADATLSGGDAARALRAMQQAVPLADQSADRRLSARVRNLAGQCLLELGRYDRARPALTGALDAIRGMHAPRLEGDARRLMAELARLQGDYDAMLGHAASALELYRRLGARQPMGRVELLMGDSLRHQGLPGEASARYRAAGRLLRATGSPMAPMADLSLASTLMELGELHEARPLLEGAVAHVRDDGSLIGAMAHGLLLACAATDEDWAAWDRHAAHALDETPFDPDLARALRRAGRLAERAGRLDRARAALDAAARQFEGLGRPAEAHAIRPGAAG